MEPNNKLEQHFKQQLEQRTIQPTEMAWDRLDAMLTVAEQKKKPNRSWMYIAASFLALLLAGTIFLNQENNDKGNGTTNVNSVVNSEKPEVIKEDNTATQITNDVVKPQDAVATTTTATPVKAVQKNSVASTSAKTIKTNTIRNKTLVNPGNVGTPNEGLVANETPQQVKTSRISVSASDLLASVENPGQVKVTSATASIDKTKQGGVKVSANTLLSSVEGELTESFRDKVLQSVSKNFNKVKTSVASRNHE